MMVMSRSTRRGKHILILSPYFYSKGGIERVVNTHFNILRKRHKVVVLCYGDNYSVERYPNGLVITLREDLNLFRNPINLLYPIFLHLLLTWADVVFVHEPNPFASSVYARLNRRYKKKTLIIYHSDIVKSGVAYLFKRFYQLTFQKLLFTQSHLILPTTKRYVYVSDTLFYWIPKIRVLPNTIDVSQFTCREGKEFYKEKLHLPKDKPVILTVGRLVPYKGYPIMLDALRKLNRTDYEYYIIGDGPLRKEISNKIKKFGLEGVVRLLGKVSDSQLREYYCAADIFVLPSVMRSEAFGIVLVEAMASGCAVITTDVSGTAEVVDGAGLVVPVGDSVHLAKALSLLLDNPRLINFYSKKAVKRAKLFDHDRIQDTLFSIVE